MGGAFPQTAFSSRMKSSKRRCSINCACITSTHAHQLALRAEQAAVRAAGIAWRASRWLDSLSRYDCRSGRVPQPLNSGFVIELLPTAVDGRYDLAAHRAVFALQASWFARSILDRAIRSKSCEWKSVLYQNVNLLAFAACVLCGAGTSCCGAVALARYRRPPWAFPP